LNYTVGPGTAPTPPNTVPDNPTPILESLNPTNWTESDLNCSATITDPDADDMNATIRWYKGGVLNKTENFLNQPNGTQIESSISSDLLQIEQMWECSMNLTDGLLNSNVINSSNLTILPTQTALEMINITIPDFTFSSSTYQLFYEFQFNTSDSEDFLTAVDSFNLAKLTGSGSNDIYMKFVLDDVSLFDYKVRSVSKITGQLDEGISMNLPLVSNTTNGEHTLKLYIRKTGTGDVSINDIDFTLIKLRSGLGNKVETLLLEDTYNFNSATFEEQETFLFNFTPTPAHELYFLSSVTVNSTGDTEIVCYTRDNALGVDTPYAVRSSSAGTTGTIQLSAINPVRQINFNTSLYCLSTTGEDVTAIVTALNFPMRDIKGNPFNFNFGINSATNWTNNRTLTSGSNSIVNTTLTVQNGTNALVTMSTSSYMAVHEDPVFYLATNGTAICDTKKERHFGGETTGSSFINVLCTNLSVGETYLFDFRVNNTNDMTIYDEAINVFEGTEFDIAISNTPPIASILTPIDDETIQGEYNITFDITDTQLDPYEVNITLTNSTGTYFVVENFPDGGNYLFNTTDFKDGEYNMTLIACENETTDAFCGNDTVSIMISQQPVVTILYPTNGIINHQITEINISVNWADGQGSCWYSLDDGATNSSTISGDLNFTGISEGVEGTNDLIVYCNNSNGNIGSDVTSFTIDFPPALEINSPTDGSQVDLTFKSNW